MNYELEDDFISNKIKVDSTENRAINISSIQANSLYRVNKNVENAFLDRGKAVINGSIFSEYMRKHGVTVKKNRSKDFIVMKFDYGIGEKKEEGTKPTKKRKKGVKSIKTSSDLREFYYKNGATVNWQYTDKEGNVVKTETIPYKMLMRSPGKAKEGDCIFIRENLHKLALDYITMGLYDKMPMDDAKIVELSAYSTLITATAIDYITLPLDNVFVVKDAESSVFKNAVTVKAKDVEYSKMEIDFTGPGMKELLSEHNLTFSKKKAEENPSLKLISRSKKALMENGISLEECPMVEVTYSKK